MSATPDLETQILDALREAPNRTKVLCPKDFNATANLLGMVLDEMITRAKIYRPPYLGLSSFYEHIKSDNAEVEITMYPETQ